MKPLWLAPGVSIDDVEAGLVTTCTWLNLHAVEARPATIERVRVVRGGRAVEVAIKSIEEVGGSVRTFRTGLDGNEIIRTPRRTPMCGGWALYVGERLSDDDVVHAAGGVAGPGYHRQVLCYVPRFALIAAASLFTRRALGPGGVAWRARHLAYPSLEDDDPDDDLKSRAIETLQGDAT